MPRLPAGATQDEVRRHNVSTLLRHVHVHGAISRAELTSVMGLNRSTIKALVSELDDAGLVREEIPEKRLGAGRPSHVVVPRRDAAYVLAANVGVEGVRLAAVALAGAVLARREFRIQGVGSRPEVVAGRLAGELRKLRDRVPADAWPVGVGVAVPGLVRRADGYIEHAPNLTWRNVAFGRMVGERLGLAVPLSIGNDGDVGALAEHVRGAGRGVDNMIYMAGDVGLGGGLIVDGRMVHGAGGYAGEIGHVLVNPAGRNCRCGSAGCLETEVGEDAVLIAAGLSPGSGRRAASEVLRRAKAGDRAAVAAVEHVAHWLGRGIANLVNIFNPELVLLGGALSAVFAAAEPVVRGEFERSALGVSRQQVRVAVPELGEDSLLLGAAELAFEALLHDPVVDWWRPSG